MKPKINQSKCISCFVCVDTCEVEAIKISKRTDKPWINPKICIDCGQCIEECPVGAIKRKRGKNG